MIVSLFFLFHYGFELWGKLFHQTKSIQEEKSNENPPSPYRFPLPIVEAKACLDEEVGIRFYPPVFNQRYQFVRDLLLIKHDFGGITKVVDIGCSEVSFFRFIRFLDYVEEYVGIDIDEETLKEHGHRVLPRAADYLQNRETQFRAQVYLGSASEPDICLKNTNVIVAIELIEHLYPETLEALPYNIFGIVQPEVAVFTTPNQDFNVLFKSQTKFRHFDHKFEWSRQQFQDWAENLVVRYPNYEVDIIGIGPGPKGTEELGCCTQAAVFFRKSTTIEESDAFQEIYKVIQNVEFPFRSVEEKLEDMIKNHADTYIWNASQTENFITEDRIEIPLTEIIKYVTAKCECPDELLRTILVRTGWKVECLDKGINAVILPYHGIELESSSVESFEGEVELEERTVENTYFEEYWDLETSANENMQSGNQSQPGLNDSNESLTNSVIEGSSKNTKLIEISVKIEKHKSTSIDEAVLAMESNGTLVEQTMIHECDKPVSNHKIDDSQTSGSELKFFPLHKCQSLEQIPSDKSKNKNFRFSLNMDKNDVFDCDSRGANNTKVSSENDKVMSFASLRLEDSNQSKAGDSGYPNSCSQDMDMDLTPEQVDDIITESESSFEGEGDDDSVSGEEHQEADFGHGGVVHFLDNVENGDVANNNRDGEGNNMEDNRLVGEPLEFEQLIAEGQAQANLDAAVQERELDSEEEHFFTGIQDVPQSSSLANTVHPLNSSVEISSTQAMVGSDPSSSEPSFMVVSPSGVSTSNQNNFIRIQEYRFPDWLLNMLPEEDGMGGGDASSDIDPLEFPEPNLDDVDDNVLNDIPEEDDGLDSELSLEMIVEGNILGGGDPSNRS